MDGGSGKKTSGPDGEDFVVHAPVGFGAGGVSPPGFGAVSKVSGTADGYLGPGSTAADFIAAGYPRLALAKSLGMPFAPYIIPINATFSASTATDIPEVGSDVKVTQDTIIDSVVIRLLNGGSSANSNSFQTMSDFWFNYQSGIRASLDVAGRPGYPVAPKFTPLSLLADIVGGTRWPRGWVLTYTQQLKMSFNAAIAIPASLVPLTVSVVFRAWIPIWDELVAMSNREAIRRLREECGIDTGQAYTDCACNRA